MISDTDEIEEPGKDAGFGRLRTGNELTVSFTKRRTAVTAVPEEKNDSWKNARLKNGRRKQPRIIAQFPAEFRFKADGGNFQIVQGITSNLHEGGARTSLASVRRTLDRR
jgi:hypothetical protein